MNSRKSGYGFSFVSLTIAYIFDLSILATSLGMSVYLASCATYVYYIYIYIKTYAIFQPCSWHLGL